MKKIKPMQYVSPFRVLGLILFTFILTTCLLLNGEYKKEQKIFSEWNEACVITPLGTPGKIIEIFRIDAKVAFNSGVTGVYPFATLTKTECK